MPRKKIENKKIKEKIRYILDASPLSMSIKTITEQLEKDYSIKISPQITKRYLLELEKEGKIIRENG